MGLPFSSVGRSSTASCMTLPRCRSLWLTESLALGFAFLRRCRTVHGLPATPPLGRRAGVEIVGLGFLRRGLLETKLDRSHLWERGDQMKLAPSGADEAAKGRKKDVAPPLQAGHLGLIHLQQVGDRCLRERSRLGTLRRVACRWSISASTLSYRACARGLALTKAVRSSWAPRARSQSSSVSSPSNSPLSTGKRLAAVVIAAISFAWLPVPGPVGRTPRGVVPRRRRSTGTNLLADPTCLHRGV